MTPGALHEAVHTLLRTVSEQAILPRYQKLADGEIIAKAADDVVTVADHDAEAMLTEGLARIADVPVVGEEATHADAGVLDRLAGDCWIVDPLDGTRNFAAGRPPFGILVAMASGGEAHSGWIYDCLSGRLCVAHRGKGAFVDGEKIAARETGAAKPIAALSLLFFEDGEREAIKRHIAPHYELADIPFCCAEQYPRVALGMNDLALFRRTLPWDHAGAALWLSEAGGKCARPDGSAYRVDEWDKPGLIAAASPRLWADMAERLAAIG